MSEFLKEWKIQMAGTCGAITITDADDGLVDYKLGRTKKNISLGESESIKGTAPIKFNLSKSGTLTLTVSRGSDLEEKLSLASTLMLPFIGAITDKRSSTQTKSFSFAGGISKPDIQYSVDSIEFEIVGNFQDIII